jgi:hypothetical protein
MALEVGLRWRGDPRGRSLEEHWNAKTRLKRVFWAPTPWHGRRLTPTVHLDVRQAPGAVRPDDNAGQSSCGLGRAASGQSYDSTPPPFGAVAPALKSHRTAPPFGLQPPASACAARMKRPFATGSLAALCLLLVGAPLVSPYPWFWIERHAPECSLLHPEQGCALFWPERQLSLCRSCAAVVTPFPHRAPGPRRMGQHPGVWQGSPTTDIKAKVVGQTATRTTLCPGEEHEVTVGGGRGRGGVALQVRMLHAPGRVPRGAQARMGSPIHHRDQGGNARGVEPRGSAVRDCQAPACAQWASWRLTPPHALQHRGSTMNL